MENKREDEDKGMEDLGFRKKKPPKAICTNQKNLEPKYLQKHP
jgi:hypothetical protein